MRIKLAVFHMARALGLFALCRRLTAARVRILCYHGGCIGDESRYNPKLFCSSATLSARMQWLKSNGFHLVPLGEAIASAGQAAGRTPLTTAVTFDDGWFSTASQLIPVLGKLGIPSTLYLCTSHYLEASAVPSVTVRYLIWKSALAAVQVRGLGMADGHYGLGTAALREAAADRIVAAVEGGAADPDGRHDLLEKLAACLAIAPAELALASRRFAYMNREELLALREQGCSVELHGHVHHYPVGEPNAFEEDLRQCMATIMAAGLPRPSHYCYPSGNFDAAASPLLRGMGVVSATTCLPGLVSHADETGRHYLPRFLDGESVSMLEFQAEMSGFTELLRTILRKRHPCQPA